MSEVYSYIGAGKIYIKPLSGGAGLTPVGEVSELKFAVETDDKELLSHTQSGGGLADSVSRIKSVGMDLTVNSLSPENVAMALYGTTSKVAAGVVADESHVAYPGALVPFTKVPDLAVKPVVKNQAGDTTYTEGTDYDVSASGIVVLAGGTIAAASVIKVSYTSAEFNAVEALTTGAVAYQLYFEGLNEARSDKAVFVTVHRCKFKPTSELGFITDDFASLALSGSVLKESGISGAGLSKFFKVQIAA